jgi:hypothetical protein
MCGCGAAQLHLSEHRLDSGPITHVYLYVEDVDGIIPAGAVAEDCPWEMRETRLTDPDGTRCESDPAPESGTGSPRLMSSKIVVPLTCQ